MKLIIDKEKEVSKLKGMLDVLIDEKDLQSVKFATMFPTADIATNDKLGEAGTVFVHHKDNITIFHLDWWNEPYREEKE